jgi:hypothetical protein
MLSSIPRKPSSGRIWDEFLPGMALVCLLSGQALLGQTAPLSQPAASDAAIIQRIDAAVHNREQMLLGYTVTEHYTLFRNADPKPAAEETVQSTYKQGHGKEYSPVSHSGSELFRATVLDKVIAGEKELAAASIRDSVLVTSTNYEMHPLPTPVQLNGRSCILVELKARRKNPHLFNGKAWVDSQDYTVVRLEGVPTQSVSFFAGEMTVFRDYESIDGFSMGVHAEVHSHSFLLGNSVLKIDSTGYQIQRETGAAASVASTKEPAH